MVGHTDLKMIEKSYGHLYRERVAEEDDRIGLEA
jgi:hypothetical protein